MSARPTALPPPPSVSPRPVLCYSFTWNIHPQELLKCIHYFASKHYAESGELCHVANEARLQRRAKKRGEGTMGRTMYRCMDRSALMAIGALGFLTCERCACLWTVAGMLLQEYIASLVRPVIED